MHKFYQLPPFIKWTLTLLLLGFFLFIVGVWMKLMTVHFAFYFVVFLIAPFYHFTLTPLMNLLGVYKYVSPLLLVYMPNEKQYDLHNGTGFDYFLHMRGTKPGKAIRQKLLIYYMEGFLKIIQEIESGEIPENIIVKGTSYFFSSSTARRFGFEVTPAPKDAKLNIYFNYFEILWMYSLAQGKLALPSMKNIQLAKTDGKTLLAHKERIVHYHRYLLSRNQS